MDKTKAIDAAVSQIERQFGKGSIMRMSDEDRQSVASIPTGALALDLALGTPPTPRARSREKAPVEMAEMAMLVRSPIRMMEPLPNCFSICDNAAASALDLFSSTLYPIKLLRIISHTLMLG